MPDVAVDSILPGFVEDLAPAAGTEAVVQLAMTVRHIAGDERLNRGGLDADGVVGAGDDQGRKVDRYS